MLIRELIDSFVQARALIWASATKRFYQSRLQPLRTLYGDRELDTFTRLDVDAYLQASDNILTRGKLPSDSTKRHNRIALEQLQKYARKQGLLGKRKRIFGKLEKPSVGTRDRIPTDPETKALLKHASPEFRLIYSALRQSGARPGELCGAVIANIQTDEAGERAIVLTKHKTAKKTKRARVIAIGGKLGPILERAIGQRTEGPIFLAPTGRAWTVNNLSSTYRRLRNAAGLPADLVLYLARHEHATQLCHQLGIQAAAAALGHASIQTTQRYVKTNREQLRKAQDVFDAGDVEDLDEPPAAAAVPAPTSPPGDCGSAAG